MNPLYFGSGERRIFGIYEPAALRGTRTRAAVLCNPWGSEYVYAHRSMRHLARKLSLAGYHTLRFDFFGTGDSAGEMSEAELGGWKGDVESAIGEIEDIVGAAHVTLIGLRLGANIAAAVAARRAQEIDALVLWDPIVSGEAYLQQLGVPIDAVAETQQPVGDGAATTALEVQGFPLTPAMLQELRALDLRPTLAAPATRTLMLVTQRAEIQELPVAGPSVAGVSLTGAPSVAGAPSLTCEYIPADCPWIEAATISGAVPVQAIQRIVEWLS